MIVKFFRRGTHDTKSGESVENYLLDEERQQKEQAIIFRGDPALTTAIINGLDFAKTYTSGCLSFAENEGEQLTDQQKNELMDSFESALFGDFDRDKISGYWVQHTDKNRLELNFVFANVELEKGRSLTVYNHGTDRKRLYAWKNITIADYGLIDPDHPDHKRDYLAITPSDEKKKKDNDTAPTKGKININKQAIGEHILVQAKLGKINNRDDVMSFLTDQLNVKITRETKKSITIETINANTGKPQKIRLEGSLYERDFNSIKTDPSYRADRAREYDQQYTKRIAELRKMYHNLTKYKSERLRERYNRDKARADKLARKRYQQDDQREREPTQKHSEQAQTRYSDDFRRHTEPRPANVISPGPTDDPRATRVSTFNQAELRPTATADSQPLQSPFDTTIEHGRSGIIGGAYLPSGAYQFNDLVESPTNTDYLDNNSIGGNNPNLPTTNKTIGLTTHDRYNSPGTIDITAIIRDIAKSATASFAQYATAINQYIADIKDRAKDSISDITRASEKRQQTIRDIIQQTDTVTDRVREIKIGRNNSKLDPVTAPKPPMSLVADIRKNSKFIAYVLAHINDFTVPTFENRGHFFDFIQFNKIKKFASVVRQLSTKGQDQEIINSDDRSSYYIEQLFHDKNSDRFINENSEILQLVQNPKVERGKRLTQLRMDNEPYNKLIDSVSDNRKEFLNEVLKSPSLYTENTHAWHDNYSLTKEQIKLVENYLKTLLPIDYERVQRQQGFEVLSKNENCKKILALVIDPKNFVDNTPEEVAEILEKLPTPKYSPKPTPQPSLARTRLKR
jgi:hypothetical protein